MSNDGAQQYLILDDKALLEQCDESHQRASGPGGQKRNKTSSAVRLKHRPTELTVTAADDRSQLVNKKHAIKRLRRQIAFEVRGDAALAAYTPSERLRSFVDGNGRLRVSVKNDQFYLVAAEVLDVLVAAELRVGDAAKSIGISTSHLVKFLESEPKLWERINQLRTQAGLKALRTG
ncbi:MAG: peptide chain release factor-like protein [Phycisphaerae bacterium]